LKKARIVSLGWLLVGVVALIVFVNYMGANGLLLILSRVNVVAILLLVSVELSGFLLYGTTWYILIRSAGHNIKFSMCQMITFASVFISFLTSSGFVLESLRVVLGSKEASMHTGESASTVILHRIVYIITVIVSTIAAMFALSIRGSLPHAEALQLEISSGTLIVIILLGIFLSSSPRFLQPLQSVTSSFIHPIMDHVKRLQEHEADWSIERFLSNYEDTFRRLLSNKRAMLLTFLSCSGDWSCSIILLWGVLATLGHIPSIWVVVVAMAVGEIVQMLPIPVPGMIGIYETTLTATLVTFNLPGTVSASAAILLRLIESVFDIPATGYAAYRYGYRTLMKGLS